MTLIEQLLDLEIPQSARISPDAQRILYSTKLTLGHRKREHACGTLWLAEAGVTRSSRQITSGLYDDRDPEWCPDGRSILFVSDRARAGRSSAIYLLPLSAPAGDAYPITPALKKRSIETYSVSPNGKWIAYISNDEETAEQKAKNESGDDAQVWNEHWHFNRLRIADVATQEITTLVKDNAHVTGDLAWNDEGTKVAFTQAPNPDFESIDQDGMRVRIVDVLTRQLTEVCTFPKSMSSLVWTCDTLYFIAGARTDVLVTGNAIWLIDLSKTQPWSYTRLKYDTSAGSRYPRPGEYDCPMQLRKVGGQLAAYCHTGLLGQIQLLSGEVLHSIDGDIAAWDVAHRSDGTFALATSQDDARLPTEMYSVLRPGGVTLLSSHGGAVAEKWRGKHDFLVCPTGDIKHSIKAVLFRPRRFSSGQPLPMVVYCHGGPYGRVTNSFDPTEMMWTQVLLDAGYAMLFPNYRGSSGQGSESAGSILGAAGTVDYDDVIAATQHAIDKGYADKDRLIASGWSQGGFLTYLCAVRNGLHGGGWKFKGAIVGAGISDGDTRAISSDIGAYQDDLALRPPWRCDKTDISGRTGSAIWEFKAAVDRGDVIPPMLILHGEKDERVPLDQSIAFRKAMTAARLPFQMVVYPREPHMFQERRHLVDMADRVLKFVKTHLGE